MSLDDIFQLFQNFHHRPGVEFAIAQQGFASFFSVFRAHILDFREDSHSVVAVLHTAGEVMVVKTRVIGEQSRQHTLDGKRPSNGRNIVITSLEWVDEVFYVIPDVQQILCKVWKNIGELF